MNTPAQLPHSSDGERAILGAILIDNALMSQALEMLTVEDFYVEAHKRVFGAMKALFESGSEINPIFIAEYLRQQGHLMFVGGVGDIAALTVGMPRIDKLDSYARLVRGKATLRTIIRTAYDIIAEAEAPEDEPEVVLENTERRVFGLRDKRTKGSRSELSMSDVAVQARAHLSGLNDGLNMAIGTPWARLNQACRGGFNPTELWGLIAAQKHGKSAFAKQIAAHAARNGYRVLIFSREMSELKIFYRLLAPLTEIPVSHLRHGLDQNRVNRSLSAMKELETLGIFINTQTADIEEARIRTREMVRLEKVSLVIADYTNQFSAKVRKGANRSEEVAAIWRGFKNLSQEFGIATLALGHPTSDAFEREYGRRNNGDRKAPYFHQSAESREAAKAVDVGIVLWTELGEGLPGARPSTVYIDYQRDEDSGAQVPLIFDGRIMEFHEYGVPAKPRLDFNN